jgi:hypothetical protein
MFESFAHGKIANHSNSHNRHGVWENTRNSHFSTRSFGFREPPQIRAAAMTGIEITPFIKNQAKLSVRRNTISGMVLS